MDEWKVAFEKEPFEKVKLMNKEIIINLSYFLVGLGGWNGVQRKGFFGGRGWNEVQCEVLFWRGEGGMRSSVKCFFGGGRVQ